MPQRSQEDKARDARDRERMITELRAAHHPEREALPLAPREEGPPVPDVKIEVIVAMPHETEAQKAVRLAAAERWLGQFVERVRWVSGKSDLRLVVRTTPQVASLIDLARRILPDAVIQAALEKPPTSSNP